MALSIVIVSSAFTSKTTNQEFGLVSRVLVSGTTFTYTVADPNSGLCDAVGYACKVIIDPATTGVTTITAGSVYTIDESLYLPSKESTDNEHFVN